MVSSHYAPKTCSCSLKLQEKQGFISVLIDDDNFRLLALLEFMLC